jgi:hypothetical protein
VSTSLGSSQTQPSTVKVEPKSKKGELGSLLTCWIVASKRRTWSWSGGVSVPASALLESAAPEIHARVRLLSSPLPVTTSGFAPHGT